MIKYLILTSLFILAASVNAIASETRGQDGNGGFGVSCNGSIETLDLHEARERYNLKLDLGSDEVSVNSKIDKMLSRMERINPEAANHFRQQLTLFWNKAEILNNKKVINNQTSIIASEIDFSIDIGTSVIAENCELLPLARNIFNQSLSKNIYFVGKYWDQLDNNNKAALILHEMIYLDSLTNLLVTLNLGPAPEKNSLHVRKLVALLASSEAETYTVDQLLTHLLSLNGNKLFHKATPIYFNINGFIFEQFLPAFDGSYFKLDKTQTYISRLQAIPLTRGSLKTISLGGQEVSIYLDGTGNDKHINFITPLLPNKFSIDDSNGRPRFQSSFSNGSVEFTTSGSNTATQIELTDKLNFKEINNAVVNKINLPLLGELNPDSLASLVFNSDNQIQAIDSIPFKISKNNIEAQKTRVVYIYENKQLKEIQLAGKGLTTDFMIKNKYLKGYFYNITDKATLYPDGSIKCIVPSWISSYEVFINNSWTPVNIKSDVYDTNPQGVEFSPSGVPLKLGCQLND